MPANDPFLQRVRTTLIPELRRQGFRGQFPRFRRLKNELVHEISVQGWRYGGQRTINLSFGFTFLQPEYLEEKAPQTEYSYRIGTFDGRDRWWQYSGATESEAVALADNMLRMYWAEAPKFFECYKAFPDSFTHFTADDFVNAPISYLPPRIGGWRNVVRDCWVFTKLWLHLGDKSRAQPFAKLGLEQGGRDSALEPDFLKALD